MTVVLAQEVLRLTGGTIARVTPLGRGFTVAKVHRFHLTDGSTVVTKSAPLEPADAVQQIRFGLDVESLVLDALPSPLVPELIGAATGLLVMQDIGNVGWLPNSGLDRQPAPLPELADLVWATLERIRSLPIPDGLPRGHHGFSRVWDRLDPAESAGLEIRPELWQDLARALKAAAVSHRFEPKVLVHGDFKGNNLCLRESGLTVVDWADAYLGDVGRDETEAAIWLRVCGLTDATPPGGFKFGLLAVVCGLLVEDLLMTSWVGARGRVARDLKHRSTMAALRAFAELREIAMD